MVVTKEKITVGEKKTATARKITRVRHTIGNKDSNIILEDGEKWHDQKQYQEDTTGLDRNGWKWEFLRRNIQYQSAYKESKNILDAQIRKANAGNFSLHDFIDPSQRAKDIEGKIKFLKNARGERLRNIKLPLPFDFNLANKGKVQEIAKKTISILRSKKIKQMNLLEEIDELLDLLHDALAMAKKYATQQNQYLDYQFFAEHFRRKLSDPELAVFVFDITHHIPSQTKAVEDELIGIQDAYKKAIDDQLKKHNRAYPKRGMTRGMPDFIKNELRPTISQLRILDARAIKDKSGKKVSFSKIGKILFGVDDANQAATRAQQEYAYAKIMWDLL